jgi:WD40 repeat protein
MELDVTQRALAQRAPGFAPFLLRVIDDYLGLALQQNETIDLFRPDFPNQVDEEAALFGGKADNVLREIQSFTDLRHSKDKSLGSVGWLPNAKGVVAVACLENANFEERVAQSGKVRSSLILIWNFVDPIHPQVLLEAPSDVTALKFHPSTSILVAGCTNGQILYYDLSTSLNGSATSQLHKDGDPTAQRVNIPMIPCTVASSIEASHRTAVMDIVWLHSTQEFNKGRTTTNLLDQSSTKDSLVKAASTTGGVAKGSGSSSQFITIAPDGQMLLWDIRFKKDVKEMDMFWVPLHRMALTRLDMREELTLAAISLSSLNTKFVAATEDGELVLADRAPLMEGTRVQPYINPWHHGPIRSLERSPFFEDILLTVGDWTVAVWKEGAGTVPLLTSPHCTAAVTVGRWSPTRPGVFYVCRADGSIDVWDLMDKAHIPTMSQQVASCALASMEFPPADMPSMLKQTNQLVVGDEAGTLHLLEVPKNLVRQAPNERGLVDAFLKREQARIDSTASWSRDKGKISFHLQTILIQIYRTKN